MTKKIKQSITYLFKEYKRLRKTEKNNGISEEEKDTLSKLSIFLKIK